MDALFGPIGVLEAFDALLHVCHLLSFLWVQLHVRLEGAKGGEKEGISKW
jgi:hypothetical protein